MKKVIAIDMDDTLAKLLLHWVAAINESEGENVELHEIKCWNIQKYFRCGNNVYSHLTYDLFRKLEVFEDSQRVVRKLVEKYDVYIVSSATNTPEGMVAKIEWLKEHFDFIPASNIVMCGKKDIIKADIMIDDGVHNLESFNGRGILFNAHHNSDNDKFQRVMNWNEIEKLLL